MRWKTSLVWFRRDLRAFDHAALHYALASSDRVYCVFLYDQSILADLPRADRRVEFIHACIAELDVELRALGGHLIALIAPDAQAIVALAEQLQVDAVFANGDVEPQAIARDAAVADALVQAGRAWCCSKDQVVLEKNDLLTLAGKPYMVFTPYKNAWLKRVELEPALLDAFPVQALRARLAPAQAESALPTLADVGFVPTNLTALNIPTGMSGGAALFDDFIKRIVHYGTARNFPSVKGVSYLSLHLRFGTVSIRHLVRSVRRLIAHGAGGTGAPVWLGELVWREFYQMILFQFPHVVERAFKPGFDAIKWETGERADAHFAAWCEGCTGYPLVDAAMAQLNHSGYMHNRLRMVAACFLVKDLGIDWRRGEQYFARHLNDFDLAANNGGWQWAASSGCDAQPWFRIFNPLTQSIKFDAEGSFIRRYLPQLEGLDDAQIHAPYLVPRAMLEQHSVRLGIDYPAPIVEHAAARARTLNRYAIVRRAAAS